jgi:hypothetical protein
VRPPYHSAMPRRRVTLKVLLLLIAGAALNIAVAWGLACGIDPYQAAIEGNTVIVAEDMYTVTRRARTGAVSIQMISEESVFSLDNPGVAEIALPLNINTLERRLRPIRYSQRAHVDYGRQGVTAEAQGWPVLCLWADHAIEPAGIAFDVAGGMAVTRPTWPAVMTSLNQPFKFDGYFEQVVPRILPLRPLWPGFAINTVFYAGVLWVLFFAPFALRRRLRRRRGLCPACAYPVGTNERCTECGTPHVAVKPL